MAPRTRVKERAEEQASAMSTDQHAAIRIVANDLHRLNQSVMKAVEAGVSVELVRSARHHGGNGNWGDLLIPVIVTQGLSDAPFAFEWYRRVVRVTLRNSAKIMNPVRSRCTARHAEHFRSAPYIVVWRSTLRSPPFLPPEGPAILGNLQ